MAAERHGRKSMRWGEGGRERAWWKRMLGGINGSSNTRMPTHDHSHLLHTPHAAAPSCCGVSARGRSWWLAMTSWRQGASQSRLLLVPDLIGGPIKARRWGRGTTPSKRRPWNVAPPGPSTVTFTRGVNTTFSSVLQYENSIQQM